MKKASTGPLIIGHRGASAAAPENTLAAFQRPIDDGADGLQFDVRLARDHVPVVIHNPTLNPTGRITAPVAAMSSQELARIDVGSYFAQHQRFTSSSRERALARIATLAATPEFL